MDQRRDDDDDDDDDETSRGVGAAWKNQREFGVVDGEDEAGVDVVVVARCGGRARGR